MYCDMLNGTPNFPEALLICLHSFNFFLSTFWFAFSLSIYIQFTYTFFHKKVDIHIYPMNICFLFFNDFYFFHYSWFTVFRQFYTVQQSDPVTHTHTHTHIYIHTTHTYTYIYTHKLFLTLSSIMFHQN